MKKSFFFISNIMSSSSVNPLTLALRNAKLQSTRNVPIPVRLAWEKQAVRKEEQEQHIRNNYVGWRGRIYKGGATAHGYLFCSNFVGHTTTRSGRK